MTACFKLVRALQQQPPANSGHHCASCVYFSKNLDQTEYPHLMDRAQCCGLGFLQGDPGCKEMRTGNCSVRKK